MSLKNLSAFQPFDLPSFLSGKELTVTASRSWKDFQTKAEMGTVVEVAITKDETNYPPNRDGKVETNLYEKIAVKVPKSISIPAGVVITIINGTATVYGDFRNQLSIRAEDVKIIQTTATPASPPVNSKSGG